MLELTLLGPVEARVEGGRVPLAPLERCLLAMLGLSAGSVVSTERIIDGLWRDHLPASPRSRVQGLVSTLRRKVGGSLVTRSPGYLLRDVSIDLDRCNDIAGHARLAATPAEKAALLREAVHLWRGEPLDGVAAPGTVASRVRLTETRISLAEELFEAELDLGRHAELVPDLVAAVTTDPLRERLTGQLMTALYRSNRQAEAHQVYGSLRRRLAEELGSDPCADLRELHLTILRGRAIHVPAPAKEETKPAQMPASVGHFIGRDADLTALTVALPHADDEPRVVLISGAGGLGKTALAVRWAHAVADRFPDGQIFVDLRGSRDGVLTPGVALGATLLALGQAVDQLPVSVDERAARYRTLVHGRRFLLVADDANSIGQLLPLVPPTSGSLIVATSRGQLTALTAHHAVRRLIIEPLTDNASLALLRAIVGEERLRTPGADDIVRLCGGWPLAIRLAGATLAARSRQSLTSFAAELCERVDVLTVADDPRTVRAALAAAHAGLELAARRLFAQLGVLPTPTVSLELAAAAAGTSTLRARLLLDALISANLVAEVDAEDYHCHDMIWRYARRCGAALPDRAVVEERVIRWYLSAHRIGEDADPSAVVRWVAARGTPDLTWQLLSAAHTAGAVLPVSSYELGLAAAQRLDDRQCIGEAHAYLGLALVPATEHLARAVDMLETSTGPVAGAASFALAVLRAHQGQPAEAQAIVERALDQLEPGREPISYAIALLGYAEVLHIAGAPARVQTPFAQAVILCAATADVRFHGEFVEPSVAIEFLDYVTRCLSMSRVAVADRELANRLLGVCRAAGVGSGLLRHLPRDRAMLDVAIA
ncbi:MAG: BTAD domain-containing putative transcriptional regulator [Nocardioidaceae bacterium]